MDGALIEMHPDDIYVAGRLIAQWFPVDLDVDLATLRVHVRPRERLPLQLRMERERRNIASGTSASSADPGYARALVPYKWLSVPAIHQTIGLELRRGKGISTTETPSRAS